MDTYPDLVWKTKEQQKELLQMVLNDGKNAINLDFGSDIKGSKGDLPGVVTSKHFGSAGGSKFPAPTRMTGSLAALSGGSTMSYMETSKSANRTMGKDPKNLVRNKIFIQRDKQRDAAKKQQQQ